MPATDFRPRPLGALVLVFAIVSQPAIARAAEPQKIELAVDGLTREALVYLPSKASESPAPVLFAFHGHGGTAQQASRSFRFQEHWPEAIVVYMQGVLTPGRLTDPEGKRSGWQHNVGDHGDRDVKFFDALLARLRQEHKIDARRLYASGHSNGAAFTYVLWAARGERFAAFAPSAGSSRSIRSLKPKPALHVAGEADPLVKFEGQKLVMQTVRRINGCEEQGKEWAPNCTLYPSPHGTPFVALIHPGDHKYFADASPLIVRWFREHALKSDPPQ